MEISSMSWFYSWGKGQYVTSIYNSFTFKKSTILPFMLNPLNTNYEQPLGLVVGFWV